MQIWAGRWEDANFPRLRFASTGLPSAVVLRKFEDCELERATVPAPMLGLCGAKLDVDASRIKL